MEALAPSRESGSAQVQEVCDWADRRFCSSTSAISGATLAIWSGAVCGLACALCSVPKWWPALRSVEERSGAWGLGLCARSSSSSVGSWFGSSWTVVLSCLWFCRPGFLEPGRSVEIEPRQEGSG